MKIVILLFACVALLNFSKVGAMENGHHTHSNGIQNPRPEVGTLDDGRHTYSNGIQNPRYGNADAPSHFLNAYLLTNSYFSLVQKFDKSLFIEVGAMDNGHHTHSNGIRNPRPAVNAINILPHTHPTGIQDPRPSDANAPRSRISIQRVVNGRHLAQHLLLGYLEPDRTIASRSGDYGYAIVELNNGQRLYACLENRRSHEDDTEVERIGARFVPEFTAVVRISGGPRLEADLTTGNRRTSLVQNVEEEAQLHGLHSVGHIRYIDSYEITFNGALYQLPQYMQGNFIPAIGEQKR